jgi:hypothetical protein
MSVAIQANEKLTQLVSLTARIESYLNPNAGKGKEAKTAKTTVGGTDMSKDASTISGLSVSMTALIKETSKMKENSGKKIKNFLIDFAYGIKEATQAIGNDSKGIDVLLKGMGEILKGVSKFALGMVTIALLSPLVTLGSLVFALSIRAIIWSLKNATENTKNGADALTFIMGLGSSIVKFALTMVGIGLVAPLFAIGVLVFTLSIRAIIGSLKNATENSKSGAEAMRFIMGLGSSIAKFALVMVGIALVAPLFAIGTLVFALSIRAIIWSIKNVTENSKSGAQALQFILGLGKSIAIFALTMVGIGLVAPLFALGTLVFALSIGAITLVFNEMGKREETINKGIGILKNMLKPVALFGAILALAGIFSTPIAIGAVVLGLSIPFIGGALFLVGNLDKAGMVTKGATVLDKIAIPMILFAGALAILGTLVKDDPGTLALKMAVVAGAIVVLGLAAYVLGQPEVAIFAEIGAGVLITLGASLMIFSGALFILSKANFTKEQADNLGYAIWTMGKAVAKIGVLAIPVALGSAVLIPMSIALLPLTGSLALFKTIGWKKDDGDSLQNALSSVVQGFAHALDGVGVLGLVKLMAAIPIIALIGGALAFLAVGVKSMATLSFTEMEYDTKEKKLIPKRQVKLTDAEIQAVGPNVASILNALAKPLTEFGEWAVKGSIGFGGIRIGSSYMETGIEVAGRIGNVIGSIAEGVAKMANLEVIEYGIVGKGTKNAKLAPKGSRKLIEDDFTAAGNNVTAILNALTYPLSKFGEESTKGEGLIWGDGYIEKGIDAAAKVGNVISSIADGVLKMAAGEVVTNVVVGTGKNAKIVPLSVRKLTGVYDPVTGEATGDYKNAADNVKAILMSLVNPLKTFGEAYKKGNSWFTSSELEAGIDAVAKVSDPIAKLADTVIKLAGGEIVVNKVVDGKIVPGSILSFKDSIDPAIKSLDSILTLLPDSLIKFGDYYNTNEKKIESGLEVMPKITSFSKDMGSIAEAYKKTAENLFEVQKQKVDVFAVFTNYASSLSKIGTTFEKMDEKKVGFYNSFAKTTEGLTRIISPFEKFTKMFGQFTKDMAYFVKTWGSFGKDNSDYFKTFAESVKTLSMVNTENLKATTEALREQMKASVAFDQQKIEEPKALKNRLTNTFGFGTSQVPVFTPTQPTQEKSSRGISQDVIQGNNSSITNGTVIDKLTVTNLYVNGRPF